MNQTLKSIGIAAIIVTALVIAFFLLKGCGGEEKEMVKTELVKGHSDTTMSKKDNTIRWVREDCHKNHYPTKAKLTIRHSHDTVFIDFTRELVTYARADTFQIGKATIYRNDSLQGQIIASDIGCMGCGYDTVFVSRVDTLKITNEKKSGKWSLGGHIGATAGWNILPPYLPCICVGAGVGMNYRIVPFK